MVPEAGGDSPSELRQGEAAMRMGERKARMGGWMGRVRKPLIKSEQEEERGADGS